MSAQRCDHCGTEGVSLTKWRVIKMEDDESRVLWLCDACATPLRNLLQAVPRKRHTLVHIQSPDEMRPDITLLRQAGLDGTAKSHRIVREVATHAEAEEILRKDKARRERRKRAN